MERRWVTAREVAEHFGLSEPTVWRYARDGIFPRYRLTPRATRFDLHECEGAVRARRGVKSA